MGRTGEQKLMTHKLPFSITVNKLLAILEHTHSLTNTSVGNPPSISP